jgi:hypothetical protein
MDININGDGNAIGNGNRIIVDKRTTINNNTVNGNGPDKPSEQPPLALALGVAVFVALAIAAWKFAQYAPIIYLALKACVIILLCVKAGTTLALFNRQPKIWLIDQGLGSVAVVLAGFGIWMSASSYSTELTQLAQQTTVWKKFWCGLSLHGKQVALFHMLSMTVFAIPSLMFALFGGIGALARWLFVVTGMGFIGRVAMIQRRWISITTLVFATICFLSQLDISRIAWGTWFEANATFSNYLCKNR